MASMKKTATTNDLDPSIYLYDELYDDIKQETSVFGRVKSKGLRQEAGPNEPEAPKFLHGLLKNAEIRKKDKERRKFRRYAREREDEDPEQFKDKEVFVTASYKDRLKYIEQIETETGIESSSKHASHTEQILDSSPLNERHEDAEDEPTQDQFDNPGEQPVEIPQPVDRVTIVREKLAKRTVGQVFDDALARYRQRKSEIGST